MSELTRALLIASVYRYLLIFAGVLFTYMGYRLFVLGYFQKAGEIRAAYGTTHLLVKQAAPGVFFALFGVLTIGVCVFRKIEISIPQTPRTGLFSPPCSESRSELTGQGAKPEKAPKEGTAPIKH